MFARPIARVGGMQGELPPYSPALSQVGIGSETTVGSSTLSAASFAGGILNRTGPAAGFTDTWPTADQLLNLLPNPQVGDTFGLIYRNGVAQAMTFAAGTGIVSGIGTLNVAASSTRWYVHTVLSNKPTVIIVGDVTNTTFTLTNIKDVDLAKVMPGMGVTGTNVGANAVVLGVAQGATADTGVITVSVASTGTGAMTALTFFPRIRLDSVGVMTN
jgi:hypothetical protein